MKRTLFCDGIFHSGVHETDTFRFSGGHGWDDHPAPIGISPRMADYTKEISLGESTPIPA
jgi:hypothetical protein